jgi:4-hydroxy-tetrahydrodipicolinate synthase
MVARLRARFGTAIAGIKDSSGDWATAQAFLAAHGDIAVLIGDERLLPKAMALGAEGSICGLANIAPELMVPVIHRGGDGARVVEAVDLIVSLPVLPAVKALVAHVARDPGFGTLRPPLVPLSEAQHRTLTEGFDAILATAA